VVDDRVPRTRADDAEVEVTHDPIVPALAARSSGA
jgi:hypothetical protein